MKKWINAIFFLLLSIGASFSQEKNDKIPRQIFTTVEQAPEFPGGGAGLKRYILKNIRYPKRAYKNHVEGKVLVRFVVETDGSISSPEIIQSLGPDCDKETIRMIHKMPRWNPGRQNGVSAAVYYSLPVSFKLN